MECGLSTQKIKRVLLIPNYNYMCKSIRMYYSKKYFIEQGLTLENAIKLTNQFIL